MNRSKLKSYAPKARRDFIRAVTDRAARFGITASQVEPAHEQGDAVVILGTPYPRSVGEQRRKLLRRIEINAFEQVMEEIAYTWFNRSAAIRFMEVNGYLDHGLRVLSHPAGKAIPEILEKAELAELPGLPKAQVLEMKLDGRSDAELYRLLLVAQCNALHKAMPFLFERIDDETELLLPDNLLHSDSLIRQMVEATDEADWRQIEIIGWLYQFYIAEKKDQVIGKVVRSEEIPAATQLFTPNWIVKYMVQNSLGAKWLATYPDSALKAKMEYYIEPAEQAAEVQAQLAEITPKSLDPEAITLMDPACGSGHILIEAYNLFREIYLERGYQTRDIPRLILEKNLYGLEICDRAAQLAGFAVLMRARRDDAKILENPPKLNILAIQSSKGLDAKAIARELLREERVEVVPSDLLPETLPQPVMSTNSTAGVTEQDIWEFLAGFECAKTFGSLIQVPERLNAKLPRLQAVISGASGDLHRQDAARSINSFVCQALILSKTFDHVVTNPPYMGSRYFSGLLKRFASTFYKIEKGDLYACFMGRALRYCGTEGSFSFITIPNWMFLPTYAALRSYLFSHSTIKNLIHLGRGIFGSDFGTCCFTVDRTKCHDYRASYRRLFTQQGSVSSIEQLRVSFFQASEYHASIKQLSQVPGQPIAYWASEQLRSSFGRFPSISRVAEAKQGLATADNDRFLRLWWEVSHESICFTCTSTTATKHLFAKWYPYNKGGDFRKWFGNCEYIVNWERDGHEIRHFRDADGNLRSAVRNPSYYFRPGITWTDVSISSFGARALPAGFVFDVAGSCVFSDLDALILGYLCTSVAFEFLRIINPTLHFQVGNIASLPVAFDNEDSRSEEVREIVERAVEISRKDWNGFETAWGFEALGPVINQARTRSTEAGLSAWQTDRRKALLEMKALEERNNRLFIEAFGLQDELSPDTPEEQITLARVNREADIKRLVSYAVGCMMGRYSLDGPGLIYAHAGNAGFDPGRYKTFPADADGIVPLTDIDWFVDDAANRFVEFIKVAWPAETLAENLAFVAESLGGKSGETSADTIRRYLSQSFFKDHLQTYKRRPIYWLFSSGKQKAFEALVYLHRYNEGTLARLRMAYVTPLMAMLRGRIDQLDEQAKVASSTAAARKLEKTRSRLLAKQSELVEFDEKLRHYADQRITLDLDDGVKVNYAKFGDLLAEVKAVTGQKEG